MLGRVTIRAYRMNKYLASPLGGEELVEALDQELQKYRGAHVVIDFQYVHAINGSCMHRLVEHIREILQDPQRRHFTFAFENTSGSVAQWATRAINQNRVPISHREEKKRPTPLEMAQQYWRRGHFR